MSDLLNYKRDTKDFETALLLNYKRDTKDFETALKLANEYDGIEPFVQVCDAIACALHEARCEGYREGAATPPDRVTISKYSDVHLLEVSLRLSEESYRRVEAKRRLHG